MRVIIITTFFCAWASATIAQRTLVTDKANIRQELKLAGTPVDEIDSTLVGADHSGLPTSLAVKNYVDSTALGGADLSEVYDSLAKRAIIFDAQDVILRPCEASRSVYFYVTILDDSIRVSHDISSLISETGEGWTEVSVIEWDGFAVAEYVGVNLTAGSYSPVFEYKGISTSTVFNVFDQPCYSDTLANYPDQTELADSTAAIRGDFPFVDSTRLVQDSILVYYRAGSEVGRDTIYGGSSGSGTVTSVGLSLPSFMTVSGSPVTTTGTLTGTLATQSPNTVFAGPGSGGAAAPTFRNLVAADIISGGGAVGAGTNKQYAYWSSSNTITSSPILNIATTYSGTGLGLEIGADVTDDLSRLNIVGANLLIGCNASNVGAHWESASRTNNTNKVAILKMPNYSGGVTGLFYGFSFGLNSNYIYFGGNGSVLGAVAGNPPDRMYFTTSGGTGYSRVMIDADGDLGISGISNASLTPQYRLDIGMGVSGGSMRITPSSAPINSPGVFYTSTTNEAMFMDGTNSFRLAKAALDDFSQGAIPIGHTNGELTQSSELTWNEADKRLGIKTGPAGPVATVQIGNSSYGQSPTTVPMYIYTSTQANTSGNYWEVPDHAVASTINRDTAISTQDSVWVGGIKAYGSIPSQAVPKIIGSIGFKHVNRDSASSTINKWLGKLYVTLANDNAYTSATLRLIEALGGKYFRINTDQLRLNSSGGIRYADINQSSSSFWGEFYLNNLNQFSGSAKYNIVQNPSTKEIRYDTVYSQSRGLLYGEPLDSIITADETELTLLSGWAILGDNSGHWTWTDTSAICNGPSHRIKIDLRGSYWAASAGEVQCHIGYSTATGNGVYNDIDGQSPISYAPAASPATFQFTNQAILQVSAGYEIKFKAAAQGGMRFREIGVTFTQID